MTQQQDKAETTQDKLPVELGSGTPSAERSKQTSDKKTKGKSLSPEEERKLRSDATAADGRYRLLLVERDQLKDQVGTLNTRLDEIETVQRTRAYEEARTDSSGNALRQIQADEAVRTREKKVQERENEAQRRDAQLKADREAFATESGETMVSVVAAKHGVDPERLAKLGITDKATLETVAADMKASTPTAETKPLTEEQEAAKIEAEEKGETFSPLDEAPSAVKPVDLTSEGVEKAPMEALEQALAPPVK